MADLKRWFKVWTSVLVDMDNLPAEAIGHWVRLGARIALVGTKGTVRFDNAHHAARFFQVHPEKVRHVVNMLPGVCLEEGETVNGGFAVTMKNWSKYQEDSTIAQRVQRLRSKRRGEEKRGEETRREEKHPPVVPPQGDPTFQQFWTAYPKARQIGKGKAEAAWRKVRPSQALVADILAALERQKAGVRWREDGGRYVPLPATWLNQRRWEDTVTEGPLLSQKTQGNLANLQAFIEANRDPR